MVTRYTIRAKLYQDSVKLMRISAEAKTLPGIEQAVAIMGTEMNKATLESSGLLVEEAATAGPNDLVIVVQGRDNPAVDAALARIEEMLADQRQVAGGGRPARGPGGRGHSPRSIASALRQCPDANLALISVPGAYAAAEAAKALRRGLHVHIFSDNVSLEAEIELKKLGRDRGLLVMGPDCGTAIINGVPLAFANVVGRGPIGIVGASGTGIQQASVLIDRLGSGITHAIGIGGRDLSDAVGGIMMLMGLEALEHDPDTRVILLISKPPGPRTARRILERVKVATKPIVVNFLGGDPTLAEQVGAAGAKTLEEAAVKAVVLSRTLSPSNLSISTTSAFAREESGLVASEVAAKQAGQRHLRGLYTGGTLADEAMLVLKEYIGDIHSNIPLRPELKLPNPRQSLGHSVIDLGDDEFTRGRPHPMIDPSYRGERLVTEACDPEVAVILCDVVLGYGSHPDPAGALAAAVRTARARAGRPFTVVASVCGAKGDPQNLERQEEILRQEGILVLPSNAHAAEVAGEIARRCAERGAV